MDGREYRCSAGRVDWRQVYREFVSDTRAQETPFTALGSNATYFYWAFVLSVTDCEVKVEVQVNEEVPKRRGLLSMDDGRNDGDCCVFPSWRMQKHTEIFTISNGIH